MQKTQTKTKAASSRGTEQVLQITRSLNMAKNIDDILLKLKSKILDVCHAERITIYALDERTMELYTKVGADNSVVEIREPVSKESIVGYTASTGETVNIKDAYSPEALTPYPGCKFDDRWDKKTGFKTKAVLSAPLRYKERAGEGTGKDTGLQGVMQLFKNKDNAYFSKSDEKLIKHVAVSLAVAFYNKKRIRKTPGKFGYLLDKDILSNEDLNQAIARARGESDSIKGDVPSVLVNQFGVSKQDMGESLARFYNTRFVPFNDKTIIPRELLQGLSENFLRKKFFVPISLEDGVITVLTDDPGDLNKIDTIRSIMLARDLMFCVALREDILNYLDLATGKKTASASLSDITEILADDDVKMTAMDDGVQDMLNDDAPVIVRMANKIIQEAYEQGASDIHIEPYPGSQPAQVRYRQDGTCSKYTEVPANHIKALTNRIKIMARLKVDEKRFPQSGKIKLKYGNREVELRVEVTPTVGGLEDVVMRILASGKPLPLEKMNFSEYNEKGLREIASKPYGLILAVGPTGSGKTTTLHSILGYLNTPDRKIWTAEDPVEITQYGLRQVQVNPNIKPIPFDFALAMRSFLRADPDIIMVGEMRDKETASMGVEASLTGHLVLSTLHTNSAPETITRLIDIGLNPINFSDALLGILAQRLVRTLCSKCKEQYTPDKHELDNLLSNYGEALAPELGIKSPKDLTLYKKAGCENCGKTGYKGRTGVHELLIGTKEIKAMIMARNTVEEIRQKAIKQGMRTLKMDGIQKVIKGQTDLEEVRRVCIE